MFKEKTRTFNFQLVFSCVAGCSIHFVYDLPGAVALDFKSATNMTNEAFMFTFYTLYSYPSAISAILAGYFIDNVFGLGLSGIVFAGLALFSQACMHKYHNTQTSQNLENY